MSVVEITPAILALFTQARRKHLGLSPVKLEEIWQLKQGQVRAAESGQRVSKITREKLLAFNELEAF